MTGPGKTAEREETERGEMPFLDHLEELRWRLLKSLIAIAAGVGAGYLIVTQWNLVGFLKRPIDPYLPAGQKLLFTSPLDPFMLTLKLALVVGLLVATPVVVWQAWGFLRPALYRRERKVVVPAALAAIALFITGAVASFYLVMPLALKVLLRFQSQSLQPIITANEYFGLATTVTLAFGAVFELPLVLLLLVYLQVITASFLRRQRPAFVVLNAALSAILTPGDIVVMTAVVMIPVQLFYELSILLATVIERRRAQQSREPGERAAEAPAPGRA
jgi:sec-independent protein translocase protein TatC